MALSTFKTNKALFYDKAADEEKLKQQQASAEQAQKQQEGGDIGGILGMLALGLGAAVVIGTGGLAAPFAMSALAAPGALGAIAGAAGAGGAIGKAVGASNPDLIKFAGPAGAIASQGISKGSSSSQTSQKEPVDLYGAMSRRVGSTETKLPPLSDRTQLMARSFKALGQMPEDVRKQYQDVLLKGMSKSFGEDILKAKGIK